MGDRPTSAQEILKIYDNILHQATNPQDLTQGRSPTDQQQPMAETPPRRPRFPRASRQPPNLTSLRHSALFAPRRASNQPIWLATISTPVKNPITSHRPPASLTLCHLALFTPKANPFTSPFTCLSTMTMTLSSQTMMRRTSSAHNLKKRRPRSREQSRYRQALFVFT